MLPSSIPMEKSSMLPPTEKNLPVPVRTTELHDWSERSSSSVDIKGTKFFVENVFADASGEIVTTATPPSIISEETGMAVEEGMHY